MTLYRSLTIIAVLGMLVGCAAPLPLQRSQIDAISRDMSPEALEQTLGKTAPTAKFEFTANGNPYFVRHYLLQTGARQESIMVCTTFCFPVFVAVPVTTQYLVVQRHPSLAMHAWGTIEELSKDPDASVSSIMPELKARLALALAEKK